MPNVLRCKYACPIAFSGPSAVHEGTSYTLITREDLLNTRTLVDAMGEEGGKDKEEKYSLIYDSDGILVWEKKMKGESNNLIKIFGTFDCSPEVLYAVLHDPLYWITFDVSRLDGFEIARLDERQGIHYYAGKPAVTGVSSREFVGQRGWHEIGGGEYVILNTAVEHTSVPVGKHKDRVRGVSKITAYLVQPWQSGGGGRGCSMTYITQVDPGGWIPSFVMNKVSTMFAPKVVTDLREATNGYAKWLKKNGSAHVDWTLPPQQDADERSNNPAAIVGDEMMSGEFPKTDKNNIRANNSRPATATQAHAARHWGLSADSVLRTPVVALPTTEEC